MLQFLLAGLALFPTVSHAQAWECYAPEPGHPTAAEKRAFVEEISPLAQSAEKNHGVPAAALAAMSIVESGYGWTRTAQAANNLFGWKYVSATSAGGRGAWSLDCQPPDDPNNKYVQFSDREDAFDFVGARLSRSSYYREDTARYRDRGDAVDIVTAVNDWVRGISDPYNWKPELYAKTLQRFMNNPFQPSDTLSPENLYRLSGEVAVLPQATVIPTANEHTADQLGMIKGIVDAKHKKGYMAQSCESVSWPNWEDFPTQICTYRVKQGSDPIRVILLDPDSERLARWIKHACEVVQTNDVSFCAKKLLNRILGQSSGHFPVAGIVMEDILPADGVAEQYAFRDGVTVRVTGVKNTKPGDPSEEEIKASLENDIVTAGKYARLQGTTRDQYEIYVVQQTNQQPENVSGIAWPNVVRHLYQQAWNSESYLLLDAWAWANRASLFAPGL